MTVTSDRQTDYRQRQKAAGLVQLNIWCRPQDRDTIRAYAASLAEGVTSHTPDETVTSDKPKVKPLPETVEELKAHAAKVKAERKAARAAKPKKKRSRNPIPTRCTDNPAQLIKVMNYHIDPANPGADEKIYYRATYKLISWCDLETLKRLISFHHPDKGNAAGRADVAVKATDELNARKRAKKKRPWYEQWEKRGAAP